MIDPTRLSGESNVTTKDKVMAGLTVSASALEMVAGIVV